VKSSAITGTVTDSSGAILPGAKVKVTETGTGSVNTTQTNEQGQYNVPYLPIGKYTVEVTVEGFQTFRKTDIDLAGGVTLRNDVQLDGNSVQGAAWRETAVIPNPDALSEVRVVTNNLTAETGLAQGVVQQTTKGGTNTIHGDANFLLRNDAFNANTFGNNLQG